MIEAGLIKREEVVVATKGGYLAFDGQLPPDPKKYIHQTWLHFHSPLRRYRKSWCFVIYTKSHLRHVDVAQVP